MNTDEGGDIRGNIVDWEKRICKYYDLAVMQPEVPETVRAHYLALEHGADACIGCHGCESCCPFGVKIADRMTKTAELFQK